MRNRVYLVGLLLALTCRQPVLGESVGTTKVRVCDPVLTRQLEQAGGELVADYGSFRLLRVPRRVAEHLRRHPHCDVPPNVDRLLLHAGVIDTATADRKPAGKFAGRRLHLIQFVGPVQPAWHRALRDTGAEVVAYVPHNGYLLYGDAGSLDRLQAWARRAPLVQWDGPYHEDQKIHPRAKQPRQPPEPGLYAIQLVADPDANPATLALLRALSQGAVRQQFRVLNYLNVIAPLPPAQLGQLARRPDVVSIQPHTTPRQLGERQCQIVAGNVVGGQPAGPGYLAWLAAKGFTQTQFTSSAFVVDVSDSGIDDGTTAPNHFGLYTEGKVKQPSRVVYNRLVGTPNPGSTLKGCDGHGTIDAHLIAGYVDTNGFPHTDGSGYHYGLGVAPFVRVGSSVIFDTAEFTYPDYTELQALAYQDGARISNNSWGDPADGAYTVESQAYDALVRDAQPAGATNATAGNQPMVIVFGAGNGGDVGATTIYMPASAKNVIAVGACEGVQTYSGAGDSFDGCLVYDDDADDADDIVGFSSRGPCADGRMKPDLMAPGTHISGGVIQQLSPGPTGDADPCFDLLTLQVCGGDILDPDFPFWPGGQEFYTASSGTSHAAPAVAGAAALVRQYFINQGAPPPSPAMTKAYLMNAARYLTGVSGNDNLWSANQGMGRVDLGRALDGTPRVLRDELAADKFTATGQTRVFTGTISDTSQPVRVTLAWTDAPGSTMGAAYNNDLDLTVTVGGNTYKGNVFVGQYSVASGAADPRNNVESVFLPAGLAGPVAVTVRAANINSDGVPGNADLLDQDFAMVVYNVIASPAATIAPESATLTGENCSPANGMIDPNESVTVELALRNVGAVDTTNLVATLQPTGGVVLPTGPQNYGALIAGGAAVSRTFGFTASGACGGPLIATLQLHDGATDLGTVVFAFTLGTPATVPVVFGYLGPPVVIPDGNAAGTNLLVEVSGFAGAVTDLNFAIDGVSCTNSATATSNGINHPWVGDLILRLTSPQGTTVTLMNRPGPPDTGSDGNNFCHTVLDDEGGGPAIQSITGAGAPYPGTFTPFEALLAFQGEDPNGTWVLNVSDNSADDEGDVRAFSLRIYGRVCCVAAADTDGDGLPDWWEQLYFGSATGAVPGEDTDGDGETNEEEYAAGTNPQDAASVLRVTAITAGAGGTVVEFTTVPGRKYQVEHRNDPLPGAWTELPTVVAGSGLVESITDPAGTGATQRVYRVKIVP